MRLVCRALDIVGANIGHNTVDRFLLDRRLFLSVVRCELPAAIRIVSILKLVGKHKLTEILIEFVLLVQLVALLTLGVTRVGGALALVHCLGQVFTAK